MDKLSEFDFIALDYDGAGHPASPTALIELQQHITQAGVSDLVFIAHGFRNDTNEARRLYGDFLQTFRCHIGRDELKAEFAARTFAVAGVFWPSKAFSEGPTKDEGSVQGLGDGADEMRSTRNQLEEIRDNDVRPEQRDTVDQALALVDDLENNAAKQDKFVRLVLSLIDEEDPDPTEGLREVKAQSGSDLLAKLRTPIVLPTSRRESDGGALAVERAGGAAAEGAPLFLGGFVKTIAGKVGQVLNLTTWYLMKNRSGTVGASAVAPAVRAMKAAHPTLRVHLVGHSLGGRCMAACTKALAVQPKVQPDSLSLLEAAFSHYGMSPDNGKGSEGFFRDVIGKEVVKGPLISTFSYQDTVVGIAYAISSRLAGDNVKAVGDKDDEFGGIGRNGTQLTPEATVQTLREVGNKYSFDLKVVNNLDGSGGPIKNHGDVTNSRVTYAFACAVGQT